MEGPLSYPLQGGGVTDELLHEWNLYAKTISTCAWHSAEPAKYNFSMQVQVPFYPVGSFHKIIDRTRCRTASAQGHDWTAFRLGPFRSSGGYDWHVVENRDLLEQVSFQRSIYVTGALQVFRSATNALLGYPPLHIHHSYMGVHNPKQLQLLLLNHQDSSCYDENGLGELCNFLSLPDGYAMRISTPISFQAIVNDVRASLSPLLSFFVEVAIRHKMFADVPRTLVQWRVNAKPISCFYCKGHPFPGTFALPQGDSVVWSSSIVPVSGTLLTFWLHSHVTLGLLEAWYIGSSAYLLGLAEKEQQSSGFTLPYCTKHSIPIGETLTEVKTHILRRIERDRMEFRCIHKVIGYNASFGDRQPMLKCSSAARVLVAGDYFTGVFFYHVPPSLVAPLQHIHYQGFVHTGNVSEYLVDWTSVFPKDIGTKCRFDRSADLLTGELVASGALELRDLVASLFFSLSTLLCVQVKLKRRILL